MRPKNKRPFVDINFTLQRVFNKEAFRPLQPEVVLAAIEGHDVFLLAATSFGKTLCFQLPAFVSSGVTVVVTPLLALMTNQVSAAQQMGIPTESISSHTPKSERARIETDLQCGHPRTRLLYVTPELCAMTGFRKLLMTVHRQGQLTRIAIDEAHCVSQWGHDFRPAYKDLSWLKQNLNCPSVPIMAVTATANASVQEDIYNILGLKKESTKFFMTSSARPNIHFEVQYFSESSPENGTDDVFPYLVSWLKKMYQRRRLVLANAAARGIIIPPDFTARIKGIIYVPLRMRAEGLAVALKDEGISAAAYHAGLDHPTRLKVQHLFTKTEQGGANLEESFNIICATTAFGMGIDMPSVRFVVHYGLSRGLEAFVQEAGRAGRDGKAAQSLVLYTREERDRSMTRNGLDHAKDRDKNQATTRTNSLQAFVGYCENTAKCRHQMIATFFGDDLSKAVCDFACDVCKEGAKKLKARKDHGLASDEDAMHFTQRESIRHYDDY